MNNERISYLPTDGFRYDPGANAYWDRCAHCRRKSAAFSRSVTDAGCVSNTATVFRICSRSSTTGTKAMFGRSPRPDRAGHGRLLSVQTLRSSVSLHERDGHEFKLDFPQLVHRYVAQRTLRTAVGARSVLGDPDRAARFSRRPVSESPMSPIACRCTGSVSEKFSEFIATSAAGIRRRDIRKVGGPLRQDQSKQGGEVVLFQTCFVQNNEPQIGRDTVEVLERNGSRCAVAIEVSVLRDARMGAWRSRIAAPSGARQSRHPDALRGAGRQSFAVNPTCSMMMRRDYPQLVERTDRPRGAKCWRKRSWIRASSCGRSATNRASTTKFQAARRRARRLSRALSSARPGRGLQRAGSSAENSRA